MQFFPATEKCSWNTCEIKNKTEIITVTIFANVEQKSYSTCIPIKGFENIREALYIFAGTAQGVREAYMSDQRQYNKTQFGMLDFNIHNIQNATFPVFDYRFVDTMIWPKFVKWQKVRNHYYTCSVEIFHRTTVQVLELDAKNQMYGLRLDKKSEDALARYLNVEQCLYWTAVNITGISSLDTENNIVFDFDFKILEQNVPFLNIQVESLIKQLKLLLKTNPDEMPSVEIFNDSHLKAILSFDGLSFDRHYEHAWKLTETILTLPVRKCQDTDELERFDTYRPAIIKIDIRNGESKDLPIWQEEHKKTARALCDQMYETLRLL